MPTLYAFDSFLRQILEPKYGYLGKVQRQKYLYEVYRLGITRTGQPPFEATAEAWPMGPVFPSFFFDFKRRPLALAAELSPEQRDLCVSVANLLGGSSGQQLSLRSHQFAEWKRAFAAISEQKTNHIAVSMIRAALTEEAQCPTKN